MSSSSQPSSDSSDLQGSAKSLARFIKDMGSALRELNSSVLLMTQFMVDGVITDELRVAVDVAAGRSAPQAGDQMDTDPFVVVDATAPPSQAADGSAVSAPSDAAPSSGVSDASEGVFESSEDPAVASPAPPVARVHVPPEFRWYAVPVGREPGIFQGAHHVTPNIERIPGGYAVRCDNEAHARTVFDRQLIEQKVRRVTFIINEEPISFQEWHETHL